MELVSPTAVANLSLAEFPVLGPDGTLCVFRCLRFAPDVLRLRMVSKDFLAAADARQRELETLELQHLQHEMTDDVLISMLKLSPALRSLNVADCCELSEAAFAAIGVVYTLERLCLRETRVCADDLALLWCGLPSLTALDIEGCDQLISHELDRFVAHTDRVAGCIRSLSLANCSHLTAVTASLLCRSCGVHLTDLDISGYDDMTGQIISDIAGCCKSLRRLRIVEVERLDNAACVSLAAECPGLTAIDFSWSGDEVTDGVRYICLSCPEIRELELRCCAGIIATDLIQAIGANCPALKVLNLNRCGSGEEGEGAPLLAAANVEMGAPCPFFDLGFHSTTACTLIAPLALRTVLLEWLDVGWLAEIIDDDAVALLLTSLTRLRVLSLEGCKMLTDRALLPLTRLSCQDSAQSGKGAASAITDGPGSQLQRLNCSWVDSITNAALHAALKIAAERTRKELEERVSIRLQRDLACGETHGCSWPQDISQLLPVYPLLVVDYYGEVWGLGADGNPTQTSLRSISADAQLFSRPCTGTGTGGSAHLRGALPDLR